MPLSSVNPDVDQLLSQSPLKLHLGCGRCGIDGFVNIDLETFDHVDVVADVSDLNFIPDGQADLVYACHVLEHFGRRQVESVLTEWARLLKPGGILRLSVPNFAACVQIYHDRGLEDGLSGLIGLISGGQRNPNDYHKMIFDEPHLTMMMEAAGLSDVRWWDWRHTEHAAFDDYSQAYLPHMDKDNGRLMSLNLEGVKP